MKKRVFGRRFKRDINERKALFKSLMSSLVLEEKIKTTEAKAKSIKAEMEKFVTKARVRGEDARYHLLKHFSPSVVDKLVLNIAPRFKERPGGYLRILKLSSRIKDNARMVLMEWVEGQREIKNEKLKMKNDKENIKKEEVKSEEKGLRKATVDKKKAKRITARKEKDEKSNKTNKK